MESSIEAYIVRHLKRLRQEAENWNNFLEADSKLNPNTNDSDVIKAFEEFFRSIPISKKNEKIRVINMMMNIYGNNCLFDLYGPRPLEEFSPKQIKMYENSLSLINEYMSSFKSLNNSGAKKLRAAIWQDLQFAYAAREYLSQYWIKGKYRYNADLRKKELIDLYLTYSSKRGAKAQAERTIEKLWSIVYQERRSRDGSYFRAAYSRAKKNKESKPLVLNESVARYTEK